MCSGGPYLNKHSVSSELTVVAHSYGVCVLACSGGTYLNKHSVSSELTVVTHSYSDQSDNVKATITIYRYQQH